MVSYKRGDICSSPEILDLYKEVSISKEYIQKNQKEIEQASKRQQEAFEQMQKDYEEACKAREDEGIVKIIAGAGAAVLGVTAIVLTAGAATPIVVTAAVSGTCSTLYGVSNIIEGTEDVYYASIGDLDSKAVNPIRDTVFMGNQGAYDVWGSLSMTVAGLCVPVSQSVNMVAGSSGSVIAKTVTSTVAKELAIDGTIDIVSENVTEYVSDKLELSGTEAALLNMGISYALEGGVDSIENRLTGNKTSFAKDMNYDDARRYNEYWDNLEKGNSTGYPGLSEDDIKKWDFANKKVDEQIALNKVDPDELMGVRMNEAGVKLDSIKGGIESGSKANTKPYTNSRPSFRKGVVEEVWENAKGPDGLVRDPNTGEVINWTPGESRKGVWDMGHIPEAKYSEMHEAYMNGELTTKEFVDWYNDPHNYRPELPSNNRSHKYE